MSMEKGVSLPMERKNSSPIHLVMSNTKQKTVFVTLKRDTASMVPGVILNITLQRNP